MPGGVAGAQPIRAAPYADQEELLLGSVNGGLGSIGSLSGSISDRSSSLSGSISGRGGSLSGSISGRGGSRSGSVSGRSSNSRRNFSSRSRSFFFFAASGQGQGNEGGKEERVFHFGHSYQKN